MPGPRNIKLHLPQPNSDEYTALTVCYPTDLTRQRWTGVPLLEVRNVIAHTIWLCHQDEVWQSGEISKNSGYFCWFHRLFIRHSGGRAILYEQVYFVLPIKELLSISVGLCQLGNTPLDDHASISVGLARQLTHRQMTKHLSWERRWRRLVGWLFSLHSEKNEWTSFLKYEVWDHTWQSMSSSVTFLKLECHDYKSDVQLHFFKSEIHSFSFYPYAMASPTMKHELSEPATLLQGRILEPATLSQVRILIVVERIS